MYKSRTYATYLLSKRSTQVDFEDTAYRVGAWYCNKSDSPLISDGIMVCRGSVRDWGQ